MYRHPALRREFRRSDHALYRCWYQNLTSDELDSREIVHDPSLYVLDVLMKDSSRQTPERDHLAYDLFYAALTACWLNMEARRFALVCRYKTHTEMLRTWKQVQDLRTRNARSAAETMHMREVYDFVYCFLVRHLPYLLAFSTSDAACRLGGRGYIVPRRALADGRTDDTMSLARGHRRAAHPESRVGSRISNRTIRTAPRMVSRPPANSST